MIGKLGLGLVTGACREGTARWHECAPARVPSGLALWIGWIALWTGRQSCGLLWWLHRGCARRCPTTPPRRHSSPGQLNKKPDGSDSKYELYKARRLGGAASGQPCLVQLGRPWCACAGERRSVTPSALYLCQRREWRRLKTTWHAGCDSAAWAVSRRVRSVPTTAPTGAATTHSSTHLPASASAQMDQIFLDLTYKMNASEIIDFDSQLYSITSTVRVGSSGWQAWP